MKKMSLPSSETPVSTGPVVANGFFPIPEDFSDHVGVSLDEFRGSRKVLVSLDVLRSLIGLAAAGIGFDEVTYRERNQDLREALARGAISDLRTHFITEGYFEKRPGSRAQAYPVDETWYLEHYPDVLEGIKAGLVDTPTQHYLVTGRREGRLPRGDISGAVRHLISALKSTEG
ncbi:hypothetical protein [Acidisoma sp. L85]|jgi:hypothetical protein|uniref:hypothetical protein n=1 Tax=Acidisoma sp. L85 TaxID=1641850 RepID=UPI00131C4BE7|nr:hypothetical protein [Acidisoma sp. L85]